MTDRVIERELTHRVIELTIKGKDMILSGKETAIKGRMRMETEFSRIIIDRKMKEEMRKIILEEISGRPIPMKLLKGKKTKEEKEAIQLLTEWHKNAEKRKDFGGKFPK